MQDFQQGINLVPFHFRKITLGSGEQIEGGASGSRHTSKEAGPCLRSKLSWSGDGEKGMDIGD